MIVTIAKWILIPCLLFILEELASYFLNRIFENTEKQIPSISQYFLKKKIQDYYQTLDSASFNTFKETVLKQYYDPSLFTTVNQHTYPVTYYLAANENREGTDIRMFDYLCDVNNFDASFQEKDHQTYKKIKYYKAYANLLKGLISGPDRPGFMLDQLFLSSQEKIEKFSVHVGTYAENVFSSHILEYELYKTYKQFNSQTQDISKIKSFMTLRNAIHKDYLAHSTKDLQHLRIELASGKNRHSLLGVQMLVLMKTKENRYRISLIQRSNAVAIAPGQFQIVPSGGFEILNDSDPGYSEYEIRDNLSPGCAIFREYLEEILGEKEFDGKGAGSVNEALLKHPQIRHINQLIQQGKAQFKFLGSAVDLVNLRNELSFVLVIDDSNYIEETTFMGNEEAKSRNFISDVYLDNFEQRNDIWSNLHGTSATMWYMFKESAIYQQLKRTNS